MKINRMAMCGNCVPIRKTITSEKLYPSGWRQTRSIAMELPQALLELVKELPYQQLDAVAKYLLKQM